MKDIYFDNFLEKYHNANSKNKKYGRYYITHLANWIYCTSYINLLDDKGGFNLEALPLVLRELVFDENVVFSEIKNRAYGFEYVLFILLDRLYEANPADGNNFLWRVVELTIKRNQGLIGKYLNKLDLVPNTVFSAKNRNKFIEGYLFSLRQKPKSNQQARKKLKLKYCPLY